MTSPATFVWLGAITCIAIAVAYVAIVRARAATGARDLALAESAELAKLLEATRRLAGESQCAVLSREVRADTHPAGSVLVVEDEPGMRELIKLVLVRAGHKVVSVADPYAALASLNHPPAISLMLVDVVMPDMDGYDLVTEARKISPGVRVVFISAFAPDPERQSSGDGFLAKPFTNASLISAVAHALP